MPRRILLVLDGSEGDEVAMAAAIGISCRNGAGIDAIVVADPEAARHRPGRGAVDIESGGIVLPEDGFAHLKRRQVEALQRVAASSTAAGVICTVAEVEGPPLPLMRRRATASDLVVLGPTGGGSLPAGTVARLVRDCPKPVIVAATPPHEKGDADVVVAFDGSPQARRALHLFLELDLALGQVVRIVAAGDDAEQAGRLVEDGVRLCAEHGIVATPDPVVEPRYPLSVLLERLRRHRPEVTVAGAGDGSAAARLLRGNMTRRMLAEPRTSLFMSM